ncbi:MAG: hypothetical protein DRJ01_17680, partial [Bacteroidetes bacterium]
MKSKPTYQELEKENIKLRKELDENFKIEETSLLDNILRSSTEMSVAVTDIDLNVIFFNPKAEEIFGYKASELIGKNLKEIHVMENVDYARVQKAIDIVRQGDIYDYWVKMDNSTGIRTLKSQVRGIWDKKNELVGFVLFTTDMTEQVDAEKEIKKLSIAVEQSANTIMITDTDGNIEYANPKFTELTGYELKEVIGKNPRILNAKIQSKEYYAEMWQTITAGNTWKGEFCNKTKQGNLYWENVTITPIKDKEKITNFLAIKEDITARKKAEMALKDSEVGLRQIIDLVPHLIFVKDEAGKFEIVNKATAEVFGTTVKDLTGRRDEEFIATEEEKKHFRADDLEVINSGKTKFIPEELITDSTNNIRYLQTTKVPFRFSPTTKPLLLGVAVDITDRKKAELKLQKQNKELKIAKEKAENSKNQIELITNNFVNGMIYQVAILDENKRKFNYVSEAVYALYGCTPDEAKENPDLIYSKVHKDDIHNLIKKEK